ncbi:MFS transporter [Streptomyces sulfonofaciens]|uniref:MFS transporter n=1 Tax=Streptomyces sulfonofaciens TaxID=68272 RepID=A0A919L992_9ACTN|nr:MFS transporter [Streptomyces sulfonofaciens]GHH88752.1 MFS transporter [Streptomyces sulfonofaciens]
MKGRTEAAPRGAGARVPKGAGAAGAQGPGADVLGNAEAGAAKRGATARVQLWLLVCGAFFVGTDVFVIPGMLPEISSSLGTSMASAGQLMTVFAIAYAVLGPVLSGLLRSAPPRWALSGALVAVCLGNLVCAGADSLLAALPGRVLVAAGACQFTPHVSALAVRLVPKEREGRALALVSGGLAMGSVAGVPAGTWAAAHTGWRVTLTVLALGTLVVAVGLVPGLKGLATQPRGRAREGLAALLAPSVRAVLGVTLLAVVAEYSVLTYAGSVLADSTGGDGSLLALLLLAFGVGGLIGNAITGMLLDGPAGRHLVLVSVAGMAVNFLLMPLAARSFGAALAAMIVWGVTGWMYNAPQQQRLLRLAGPSGPLAVSMNSSVIYTGAALGGAAGGALLTQTGGGLLSLPAAALCALALVPEFLVRRAEAASASLTAPVGD